MALPISDL